MRRIAGIILMFIVLGLHAHDTTSVKSLDAELRLLYEEFKADSLEIDKKAKDKILKLRDRMYAKEAKIRDAWKEKEKKDTLNRKEDLTVASTKVEKLELTNKRVVKKWKNEGRTLVQSLSEATDLPNTETFVLGLLKAESNVMNYLSLLSELETMVGQLMDLNIADSIKKHIPDFLQGLRAVSFASVVLNEKYDKQNRVKAQSGLDKLNFYTKEQMQSVQIDSLKQGLRLFYLTTSNMLDLIDEIESFHNEYTTVDSLSRSSKVIEISTGLSESINFEARNNNISYVPYMWRMYKTIVQDVIVKDENGGYVFDEFDMPKLRSLKKEIEEVRNKK